MEAYEIINQINTERKKHVIIQWNATQGKKSEITGECWGLTLTNDPDKYFADMNAKHKGRATHCTKFKVNSVEEGIQLCKGLYKEHGEPETEMPLPNDIDVNKELFLAIHIHYHLN